MHVDPAMVERLRSRHPLQYGYRDQDSQEIVFDPGDDPTILDRYNRCPSCEQWSPCDVRQLLEMALQCEMALQADTSKHP